MLKGELDVHGAGGLTMCLGDFSGHEVRRIDGLDGVHCG